MKLLTEELKARFKNFGTQDPEDPVVLAKFFHPYSSRVWYATEYNPETREFFGWVKWDFPELGYFTLDELENVWHMWLPMERDKFWKEKKLSEVMAMENEI